MKHLQNEIVVVDAFLEDYQQLIEGIQPGVNADDYEALKALYESTDGANWSNNTGWKDGDFNVRFVPA